MKFTLTNGKAVDGEYDSLDAAMNALMAKLWNVDPIGWRLEETDDEPKEEQPKDVPELIPDYKAAYDYLNGKDIDEMIDFCNRDEIHALNKLLTLAKAWNKVDNFTPDWEDEFQKKWSPVFTKTPAGWKFTHVAKYAIYVNPCDTDFCFKTEERAEQFGKQFIDLFREALL